MKRKVKIRTYRGKGERSSYRYMQITDAETNEMLISASPEYCYEAIAERGYEVVSFVVEN